jgi:hypothetical protein
VFTQPKIWLIGNEDAIAAGYLGGTGKPLKAEPSDRRSPSKSGL